MNEKEFFLRELKTFASTLSEKISQGGTWTIRGFVDIFKNVYAISADTKVVSKILELYLFPPYRDEKNPDFCNGFTLGSHGGYFSDRTGTKNIQYPYRQYGGHFVLGIIYSREVQNLSDELKIARNSRLSASKQKGGRVG